MCFKIKINFPQQTSQSVNNNKIDKKSENCQSEQLSVYNIAKLLDK